MLAEKFRCDAVTEVPHVMDQDPAFFFSKGITPSGHRRSRNTVGDPPKQIAVGVIINVISMKVCRLGHERGCSRSVAVTFITVTYGTVIQVELSTLINHVCSVGHGVWEECSR